MLAAVSDGGWGGGLGRAEQDTLARLLARVFAARGVTAIVDVGAHEGGYGRFLRETVGWSGRIVSFEPQAAAFERLAAAAASDPAWEAHRLGLGARAGRATLSLHAGSTLASLHPMNAAGDEILEGSPPRGSEEVQVSTLRRVWRRLGLADETVFLKTDTQGFDLEVLRGAGPRLREVVGLQSEVAVLPLYEGAPAWRDVIAWVERRGFAVSGLYLVNRAADLRAVEFDFVAVRAG